MIEYTLQSEDIEDDGSIKIYRGNSAGSNLRVAIFSVSRATETFTVTFNAGSNGTCGTASLTEASVGAGVTLPAVTPNSGYAFSGWYTAASEGTKVGDAGDTYNPTANITLYAQYAPAINRIGFNTYYLTKDDQPVGGASVLCDDITMVYDNVTYNSAVEDKMIESLNANYVASVTCGTNGWGVTFIATEDGCLSVGLVANNGKTFSITNVSSFDYIDKDGNTGINPTNSWTPETKFYGIVSINVTAGTEYKFSVAGSKMSLYGFEFTPNASVVTVTGAGYATYVPSYDLDFSAAAIKAYKVKVETQGIATLNQVNNVPAGTPVLLYKEGGAIEIIPVMTGAAAVTENDLVAGTGVAVATVDGDYTNMILNNIGGNIGFYFANGQTVATNRAYLHFDSSLAPSASAPMQIIFDDEITGVETLNIERRTTNDNSYYDLQGRRVAQPKKGLYIVNGRKVIIK